MSNTDGLNDLSSPIGGCCQCDGKSRNYQLRISPSKIGTFCLPNFCPRCCWLLLRLKFKKPYNFPPAAVLNSLDAHQKQIARIALEDGKLPKFFGPCAKSSSMLPISSLSFHHEDTDLHLYGKPDFVFDLGDASIGIVDGKTARVKKEGSDLFHAYRLQVNFYAYLAQNQPEPYTVSEGGLLYFEFDPMDDDEVRENFNNTHIWAKFKPTYVEVDLDPEGTVVPVLERIRELLDTTEAPDPRDGCCECDLVYQFAPLQSDEELTDALQRAMDRTERMHLLARKNFLKLKASLSDNEAIVRALQFSADPLGVLANWDWNDEG